MLNLKGKFFCESTEFSTKNKIMDGNLSSIACRRKDRVSLIGRLRDLLLNQNSLTKTLEWRKKILKKDTQQN